MQIEQQLDTQAKSEFTLRQQQQLLDELTDDLAQMQDERELVVVEHKKRLKRSPAATDNSSNIDEGGSRKRCFGLILKTQKQHESNETLNSSSSGGGNSNSINNIVKIKANTIAIEQYFVQTEHNEMIKQNVQTHQQQQHHQQQHPYGHEAIHDDAVVDDYEVNRTRTRQHRRQQRSRRQNHPKLQFISVQNDEVVNAGNRGEICSDESSDDDDKHGLLQSFILKDDNDGNMVITNCDNNNLIHLEEQDHYGEVNGSKSSSDIALNTADGSSDIIDGNVVIGSNCNRNVNASDQTNSIDINQHLQLTQSVTAFINDDVGVDHIDDVDNEPNDVAVVVLQQQQQSLGCLQDVANAFLQHDTLEQQRQQLSNVFVAEPQYQCNSNNNRNTNSNINNNNNLNSNNLNMLINKQQHVAYKQQQQQQDQNENSQQQAITTSAATASAICVNNVVECVEYFEQDDDLEDLKVMIVC